MKHSMWSLPFALAAGAAASVASKLYRRTHPPARSLRAPEVAESVSALAVLAGLAYPLWRDERRARRLARAKATGTVPIDVEEAQRHPERPGPRPAIGPVVAARKEAGGVKGVFKIAKQAASSWFSDNCPRLGASIAFYTIFALAPLLVVVLAIAGAVFGDEAARGQVMEQIQGIVGADAAKSVQEMLAASDEQAGDGLWHTVLGVVTALIGASAVFVEMKNAFDTIWTPKAVEGSTVTIFVRARLTAVALVLGLGFLVVASLILSAALAGLGKWLGAAVPFLAPIMSLIDVVVSTAVLTLAFFALIRWLPQVRPPASAIWIGAFTSAFLFAVGKHLIGLYLARESVASAYGAAGSFVVVILWVYYSAQIMLFGAEVTRAIETKGRPQAPGTA
jgi:membrane protein